MSEREIRISNDDVAQTLSRIAELLESQDANPFRVRAYREAAHAVRQTERPLEETLEKEGRSGLEKIQGIGSSLASAIQELLETGQLSLLNRLEGEVSPEDLLARVPGIGEELAARIHDQLDINTLEELEMAAHDGRLADVEGFGEERIRGVRQNLESMLSRSSRRRARRPRRKTTEASQAVAPGKGDTEEGEDRETRPSSGPEADTSDDGNGHLEPSVDILLAVDDEYRKKAESGKLRTIAPKRFNPEGESWLPILHTEREKWSFTALYSNTARAHELGKVRDWVVIYYELEEAEDQCTVVTETRGRMKGKRVIRGREEECLKYYARG
jgi:DNA polymerase (family X)